MYRHSGGIDGFRSMGVLVPEEQLSVIVLSNLEATDPSGIAEKLLELTIPETVTE